ncbi:hypothetical protein, partial [Blautia wexlerae]|uniref:hypothetical protein n=1 Tax=Blautia wexlerae TaxID=418240 RepID=UPI0038B29482
STLYGVMIIKDNMANMCAKVTSTYMEFTLAFGPKPEFSFSFKSFYLQAKVTRMRRAIIQVIHNFILR